MLRYHSVALLIILFCSCKEPNAVKHANGFWIHADTQSGKYYTLTVKDSTVTVNSFGLNPSQLAIWTENDSIEAHWPFDSWEIAFKLAVINDTLIKISESWETNKVEVMKYVRGDSATQFAKLLFGDADVLIRPAPTTVDSSVAEPIHLVRKSLVTQMSIGYLRVESRKFYPEFEPDSIAIQVEDVLINLGEIDRWVSRELDKLHESDRDSLVIVLNADRDVTKSFLVRIRDEIHKSHPHLKVYLTSMDWVANKPVRKVFW